MQAFSAHDDEASQWEPPARQHSQQHSQQRPAQPGGWQAPQVESESEQEQGDGHVVASVQPSFSKAVGG